MFVDPQQTVLICHARAHFAIRAAQITTALKKTLFKLAWLIIQWKCLEWFWEKENVISKAFVVFFTSQ